MCSSIYVPYTCMYINFTNMALQSIFQMYFSQSSYQLDLNNTNHYQKGQIFIDRMKGTLKVPDHRFKELCSKFKVTMHPLKLAGTL